jgi:CopG-like RHH_1 or ribbon-helix-helix domain, RHH_5
MCYVYIMDYMTSRKRITAGVTAHAGDIGQNLATPGLPVLWCMMWCMKRTNIYLADGQAEALDRVAEAEGVSRAELIRGLIDRAIGGQRGADLAADLAAIEGSFGVLAGEDAFSRGRDERMSYLDGLADA